MNSFGRNHDSVKEDNSWEEIKGRDNDFEQNENDSDNFIDDVNPQEDFTNDLANQIPIIRYEEYREELYYLSYWIYIKEIEIMISSNKSFRNYKFIFSFFISGAF